MQDLCGNSFGKESDGDGWHLAAGPFGTQDAFHVITEDAYYNGWFYCTGLKDEALIKSYAGNFTITFWIKYDHVLTSESNSDAILHFDSNYHDYQTAKKKIGITQNAVLVEETKIPLKKSIVNGTWYFFEISLSNNTWYVFCDGQYLGSGACSMGNDFYLNQNTFYTGQGYGNTYDDEFGGYLADFCVIGRQWHSPGTTYEKPTAYLTE